MKNTQLAYQLNLFEQDTVHLSSQLRNDGRSGTFMDNMNLPVHRWYRYSAGFSADWVRALVREQAVGTTLPIVIDPFGGVGTTLLACDAEKTSSYGFETHPFVYRIANAKIQGVHADLAGVRKLFGNFSDAVSDTPDANIENISPLLTRCYTEEALSSLAKMRNLFMKEFDSKSPESELLWLTITSVLRQCSGVGTAQWQYLLPNKSKSNVATPNSAFHSKAAEILQDIEYAQNCEWSRGARIIQTDARHPQAFPEFEANLVITSPPYPNNYDYADATRLEMTFWGEVNGWGDLQDVVRKYLVHSCSQHTAAEKLKLDDLLKDPILDPIRDDLSIACRLLEEIRESKGGKKTYHTMAAAYFRDLGLVFKSLRPLCAKNSLLCFVIGDSAPYGVHLEVDNWLGSLAVAAGFESFTFEKIRDRNIKWKNRKHRVPLKEGRLWIKG